MNWVFLRGYILLFSSSTKKNVIGNTMSSSHQELGAGFYVDTFYCFHSIQKKMLWVTLWVVLIKNWVRVFTWIHLFFVYCVLLLSSCHFFDKSIVIVICVTRCYHVITNRQKEGEILCGVMLFFWDIIIVITILWFLMTRYYYVMTDRKKKEKFVCIILLFLWRIIFVVVIVTLWFLWHVINMFSVFLSVITYYFMT